MNSWVLRPHHSYVFRESRYQMLSTGEVFNPSDLYKIEIPESLLEKQKEKAIKQAKKLLLSEGIIQEDQLSS